MKALLALEDGRCFQCRAFTGPGEAHGEVVFNTGMSGYQEVLTDPSYRGQMVTMTYPLVGNYGVNEQDVESDRIQVSAFLLRQYQRHPSNFASSQTLADYLQSQNVLGVDDLDTRALTRHIRSQGAMRAVVSTQDLDPESLAAKARAVPSMAGADLVTGVTSSRPYRWKDGAVIPIEGEDWAHGGIWTERGKKPCVAAFDYGVKYNILRCLEGAGCEVLVVPAGTDSAAVKALNPDGVFLSNGPGDPGPVRYAVRTIAGLIGYRPMFGICLGHQLMGLALGGTTYKMKFGHRGINQPVKHLPSGRVEITSQNHGFSVDFDSLPKGEATVTHLNLNDNTVEGLRHNSLPIFSVQYHPEASPGPHDAHYLFKEFVGLMQ